MKQKDMKMRINTKTIIVIALTAMISCNQGSHTHQDHEDHDHHGPEGVVMLNQRQMEALDLKMGTFLQRNLSTLIKVNGELDVPPGAEAGVAAIMGGNVKDIKVFQGDKVKRGQVLAVLEHPDYISLQEEFFETATKLDFLEQEYSRQKVLFENNVSAGKSFQEVESEYNSVRGKYEGLKARLRLLNLSPEAVAKGQFRTQVSVLSPLDGYINEINIRLGTYVDATDVMFGITDNREIHADFRVYEKDVHLIREGQKVNLSVAGMPEEQFTATIFAIGKELDRDSRSINVHARLENNPGYLIPGMYASGTIFADADSVRALPNDAVVKDGTKSYIFVLDENMQPKVHDHHKSDEKMEAEEAHMHEGEENGEKFVFRMVEVITGKNAGGYSEVKLMEDLPDDVKVVLNNAYYLLADLKKAETSHEH